MALLVVMLSFAIVAFFIWDKWSDSESQATPDPLDQEYEHAKQEFIRVYGRQPNEMDVISWLAEKSLKADKLEKAVQYFARIPTSTPNYGRLARYQQGAALLRLNRAAEAEKNLREFIDLEKTETQVSQAHLIDAIQRLRYLLEVQLRFEERKELIADMVRAGHGDSHDVMFFCFPSLLRWNGPNAIAKLEQFHRNDPQNLKLRIALGRYRTGQGRLEEAETILQKCHQEKPENLFATAALLALYREQGEWDKIAREVAKLPEAAENDPWLLLQMRGHSHNRQGDFRKAVKCFQLALKGDPASAASSLGLGRAYAGLKQTEKQKRALTKADVLARIQNRLGWGQNDPDDVKPFMEIAELCEQIELFEQGYLIARLAHRFSPENEEVTSLMNRLKSRLPNESAKGGNS
ncbi:MAG: hypothetical protein Tsb009_04970 [Planctomycetaceae bacterium]